MPMCSWLTLNNVNNAQDMDTLRNAQNKGKGRGALTQSGSQTLGLIFLVLYNLLLKEDTHKKKLFF